MNLNSNAVTETEARALLDRALLPSKQESGSFFLSRLLGFDMSFAGERCTAAFEAMRRLFNPQGTLYGRILATAMDVSMGHPLHHATAVPGATLEMEVQSLKPAVQACPLRSLVPAGPFAVASAVGSQGRDRRSCRATATRKSLNKS